MIKKYIKYKSKYLDLKRKQVGGGYTKVNIKGELINIYTPDDLIVTSISVDQRGPGSGPKGEILKAIYKGEECAMKVVKDNKKEDIEKEIANYKFASEKNIGPKVYFTHCCNEFPQTRTRTKLIKKDGKPYAEKIETHQILYIGYVVMEYVTNIDKFILEKSHLGKDKLIMNIENSIDRLLAIMAALKVRLIDTSSSNFGFRGDSILLLDLETLVSMPEKNEEWFKKEYGSVVKKSVIFYLHSMMV